MLTGMQDFQIDVGVPADNPREMCDFNEIGTSADDDEEVFHLKSLGFLSDQSINDFSKSNLKSNP